MMGDSAQNPLLLTVDEVLEPGCEETILQLDSSEWVLAVSEG